MMRNDFAIPYREKIEAELSHSLEQMGEKGPLRDACEYALQGGGKRFRPLLTLLIADAIGSSLEVMPAALSVEYFHTASLIADDLPCMDNDSVRRSRPSLHTAFGESTAILASYTLIAAGYRGIYQNGKEMEKSASFRGRAPWASLYCLEAASRCGGLQGATQGQFLDLNPPKITLSLVDQIIYQKTVTLFEIAFLFGWCFGGGSLEKLELVKKCALHLGRAFQIQDDLIDFDKDQHRSISINLGVVCGKEAALEIFQKELKALEAMLRELQLWTPPFRGILAWFEETLCESGRLFP